MRERRLRLRQPRPCPRLTSRGLRSIANVLETIPKGGGPVKFTLVVFDGRIAADKLPLQFKGFSAQPSPKNIEERFAPLSECELGIAEDPDAC